MDEMEVDQAHVSKRFRRLLALYRRPDGSEWGGQDRERATGETGAPSYMSNLKNCRIGNPSLAKPEAIAVAMGFPSALWFGDKGGRVADELPGPKIFNPDQWLLAASSRDITNSPGRLAMPSVVAFSR